MNDKTIKEIRINTIHVFFWCEDYNNMYTDTLRISKNWISYKRKSIKDEKITKLWDYKTNSSEYEKKYENLCKNIKSIKRPSEIVTDCGRFTIVIIYEDNTIEEYNYSGDIYYNDLDYIAYIIKSMIPFKEAYSGLLNSETEPLNTGPTNVDDKKLEELINVLLSCPTIEYSDSKNKDGVITFPYPIYKKWVHEIFELMPRDYQYSATIQRIKDSRIKIWELKTHEIAAMLTYIHQSEKFCDGFIESKINDKTLLKLLIRIKRINEYYKGGFEL